jgi:putative transposase
MVSTANITHGDLTVETFSYKLYRGKQKYLHAKIDLAGYIHNHLIALHKRYYRMYGKHLNEYKLKKHITKLKKTDRFSFWNDLDSQAIQDLA